MGSDARHGARPHTRTQPRGHPREQAGQHTAQHPPAAGRRISASLQCLDRRSREPDAADSALSSSAPLSASRAGPGVDEALTPVTSNSENDPPSGSHSTAPPGPTHRTVIPRNSPTCSWRVAPAGDSSADARSEDVVGRCHRTPPSADTLADALAAPLSFPTADVAEPARDRSRWAPATTSWPAALSVPAKRPPGRRSAAITTSPDTSDSTMASSSGPKAASMNSSSLRITGVSFPAGPSLPPAPQQPAMAGLLRCDCLLCPGGRYWPFALTAKARSVYIDRNLSTGTKTSTSQLVGFGAPVTVGRPSGRGWLPRAPPTSTDAPPSSAGSSQDTRRPTGKRGPPVRPRRSLPHPGGDAHF